MKAKHILALDAVILGLYLAAENPAATGLAWHEWLSVGLALLIAVHLALNWNWAVKVITSYFKKLFHVSRLNFIVDVLLLLAFIMVMVSGLMISQVVMAAFGLTASTTMIWRFAHSLSANAALILLAVHLGLHWRWVWSVLKHTFTRTPQTSAPQNAAAALKAE